MTGKNMMSMIKAVWYCILKISNLNILFNLKSDIIAALEGA